MNEQQINEQLEHISVIAGGLNDYAKEHIKRLLNVRYLDGVQDGLKQAQEILNEFKP